MATHSSIFVWRIPWTEETGGQQSTGSQTVRHNWSNTACSMHGCSLKATFSFIALFSICDYFTHTHTHTHTHTRVRKKTCSSFSGQTNTRSNAFGRFAFLLDVFLSLHWTEPAVKIQLLGGHTNLQENLINIWTLLRIMHKHTNVRIQKRVLQLKSLTSAHPQTQIKNSWHRERHPSYF